MELKCNIGFCTDGDFFVHSEVDLIDVTSKMYDGAKITFYDSFKSFPDDVNNYIILIADGEPNACRYAARDLMQNILCNIHTFKYYVIRDIFNMIVPAIEEYLWSGEEVNYRNYMSGNYEGTEIVLSIKE